MPLWDNRFSEMFVHLQMKASHGDTEARRREPQRSIPLFSVASCLRESPPFPSSHTAS